MVAPAGRLSPGPLWSSVGVVTSSSGVTSNIDQGAIAQDCDRDRPLDGVAQHQALEHLGCRSSGVPIQLGEKVPVPGVGERDTWSGRARATKRGRCGGSPRTQPGVI